MHGGIIHLEISRSLVGLATHVRSTLNVVLSAQGIHSHAGAADVAGHHGDVGDGHHRFGSMAVLGDAEAVEGHGIVSAGVFDSRSFDFFAGHAVDFLQFIQIKGPQPSFKIAPVFAAFGDEIPVHVARCEDVVGEHVKQRHIGAGAELQVVRGVGHKFDHPGVDDDEGHSLHGALLDLGSGHRMAFGRIRSYHEHAVGVFQINNTIGRSTGAEGFLHAPCRRAVADAGAGVDVIGAKHRADKLLHQIVFLIGAARGTDPADGIPAVLVLDAGEIFHDVIVSFIPRRLLEMAIVTDQGSPQAVLVIDELEGIPSFQAGVGVIHFGIQRRLDAQHLVPFGSHAQIASHAAVGADGPGFFGSFDALGSKNITDGGGRTGLGASPAGDTGGVFKSGIQPLDDAGGKSPAVHR